MSDSFKFIFMTDCQLGCYATFSGLTASDVQGYAKRGMNVEIVPRATGFEWDATQYARAIRMANEIKPDLVLLGGDMVDDPLDDDQIHEFRRLTAKLDPDIRVRWIPGNHDAAEDTVTPTASSMDRYREIFGDDHFEFEHKGVGFVGINTVTIDHPEELPGVYEDQRAFIEESLVSARRSGAERLIVFGHHPLFTKQADEPDSYWNLPKLRRVELLDLFHRYGVEMMLAGHWHRNSLAHHGDFEMVTTGPVGYPLGDDPSGFRVVTVERDSVKHSYIPLDTETRAQELGSNRVGEKP